MSAIQTIRQSLLVSDVTDIVVTAIGDSTTPGYRVRAIRIYGPNGTNEAAVLEVLVESKDEANIKFTTPEIDY